MAADVFHRRCENANSGNPWEEGAGRVYGGTSLVEQLGHKTESRPTQSQNSARENGITCC